MTTRHFASGLAAVAALLAGSISVVGQSQPRAVTSGAVKATASRSWVQPRTPWGDPDLQGVWTSDAARGIPRDRPASFGDRAELTDEEFATKTKNDQKTRETAENAVGSFRNDGAWLNKSFRQTSLVVEPADGRTPAFTEEARKRAAPRDRGTFGDGPFRDQYDFTLYDRCITRGIVGSIMPVV